MCLSRRRRWLALLLILLNVSDLAAQSSQAYNLYLRNGILTPSPNLESIEVNRKHRQAAVSGDTRLLIIQFYEIPGPEIAASLENSGIHLLEYLPDNGFTATVKGDLDIGLLKVSKVRAVIELEPRQKIQPELLEGNIPGYAVTVPGTVDVRVSYTKSISFDELKKELDTTKVEILSGELAAYQLFLARISPDRLEALASIPWIQYIEAVPPPEEPLNDRSAAATRANVLAVTSPPGFSLNGDGVVIGIGDGGIFAEHIDVGSRVISADPDGSFWHGLHVAGTAAGGGIVNEKYKGYAPGASIVKRSYSTIWKNAATLVRDFGMVVTSNSYGGSVCPGYGAYSADSYVLDRQADELSSLLNIFAAGNSGLIVSCEGFPAGFGNVIGGYTSSKNVITVGQTSIVGVVGSSSSKGPVQDGRIKPEITAPGTAIFSSIPVNTYQQATGTSMAAPAIAGGLALLYQRYRQLNGQANPRNALMKALLCNGASDKGLAGPDYSYGFGSMNLLRSVTMLDKGSYFSGKLSNQGMARHEITVPANTALVKIMLYWNDPAPSMLAGKKTLVNDLDIKIARSGSGDLLPLFPRAATPQVAAAMGVDSVNNVEQIVLESPAAGVYPIDIIGKKIPAGPQEYFLVYDVIETSVTLTHPVGAERFTKGDVMEISWDAYGTPGSTFSAAYSLNNGGSWTNINTAVSAGTNYVTWTVPDASTTTAKIRITQNSTGIVRESAPFTILGVPVISFSPVQCQGYAAVQWTAVAGASDYEVMRLENKEMKFVAVTSDLKYVLSGLSPDQIYYISVRARKNGIGGRRALAINRQPNSGTCEGMISDKDLAIEAIIAPVKSGRLLTSSSLTASQLVKIEIRNVDDQPVSQSFDVGYAMGAAGAPVHWETISSGIGANSVLAYTFTTPVDLHNAGSYQLTVFVKLEGDLVDANNQKSVQVRQLSNTPVNLPFSDDLESLSGQEAYTRAMGVGGTDRYDFSQDHDKGRLRVYVDPGLAYSGTKAFTIDTDSWATTLQDTYLDATYNLASYKVQNDEIHLTFRYKAYTPSNEWPLRMYVRGRDTDAWVSALDPNVTSYFTKSGGYWLVSVEVSDALKRNGQDFSTSFQVRWEQGVSYPAQTDGYTIDDIRLFTTSTDMELAQLQPPPVFSCDNTGQQAIAVLIKNRGSEDCYNLSIETQVDGAMVYQGKVPVVRADGDTLYTFSFSSNLHYAGDHNLKVFIKKAYDSNADNDEASIAVNTPPVVSDFPYLEDFENGVGGWRTVEANPLWVFGRPASAKVKEAASGTNAWTADLGKSYTGEVVSYLYSPCFSMNGLSRPALSFSTSLDLSACQGGSCDVAYVEYNLQESAWIRLGEVNSGTNWYNTRQENADVWNVQDYTRWHVSTIEIPNYFPKGYVRFRFVIKSKRAGNRAGIAIDDIHIYDSQSAIYAVALPDNSVSRGDISGDDWTPVKLHSSLVAEIHPHGQTLRQVSLETHIYQGPAEIRNKQYFLGRNFTITTAEQSYEQPVGIRFYITDEEIERLVTAPDKTGIAKPVSAYDLSITKYSGENEDGDLLNNGSVAWAYYPKAAVKKVPYAQGYYFEFSTKTFSEFWFAKDFLGPGVSLPVRLAGFSARIVEQTTQLEWQTSEEENVSHFEVQRSADAKTWTTLAGHVAAIGGGAHSYDATDPFPFAGVNYYRLKMVDLDQTYAYSQIISLDFASAGISPVVLFPNPVNDQLFIRGNARSFAEVQLYSVSGTRVRTGGKNAQIFDTSSLAAGIYRVSIRYADGSQSSHKVVVVH